MLYWILVFSFFDSRPEGFVSYQVLGSAKTQQECNKELMRLNTIHRHGTGYCFRESTNDGNNK